MTAIERAKELLAAIAETKTTLEAMVRVRDEAVKALTDDYAKRIAPVKAQLDGLDKELKALMKAEQAEIFDGGDKVELAVGTLICTSALHTTIPRNALEKIKELGWTEAVIVEERVNRKVVQGWPDEKVVAIGGGRKIKTTFGYELKGESDEAE